MSLSYHTTVIEELNAVPPSLSTSLSFVAVRRPEQLGSDATEAQ
jgi:hypothetical protein